MSVLFIIFSKARIWPKRSSSRYFGSFIEILTFHWAEIGGGRVPPVIMNLKNLFEFFRMHTANENIKILQSNNSFWRPPWFHLATPRNFTSTTSQHFINDFNISFMS